jgi:hypothetical protein
MGGFFVAQRQWHMAEAAAPADQTPAADRTESLPTDWDGQIARLQQTFEEASIAANAQRDLEMQGIDPNAPADDEQSESSAPDEVELPDDEPTTQADQPTDQPPPGQPQESKRYSRKDAQRLDQQLQEATRELNELRTFRATTETTNRQILGKLATLTGADGRFDQLAEKVLSGTASEQERRQVAEMKEWRTALHPVYEVARGEVWDAFSRDFGELKKFDGVTQSVYDELLKAPNPARLLHRVYEIGVQSGRKQADSEAKRLEAANSALRTRTAASRPQPVPATNGATPKPPKVMEQMFKTGPDGQRELNPEFWDRARRNEFLGVDLSQ